MVSSLRQFFTGSKGFVLVSTDEYAPAPAIDGIAIEDASTYPPGWESLSFTSSQSKVSMRVSTGETDGDLWDNLDSFCVQHNYITLNIAQISMSRTVFARTFGAGQWDSAIGAYRSAGVVSPVYRSVLVCFARQEKIMGIYFTRVKVQPGEALLDNPDGYLLSVPLVGYVQEPLEPGSGKFAVYPPRKRA